MSDYQAFGRDFSLSPQCRIDEQVNTIPINSASKRYRVYLGG